MARKPENTFRQSVHRHLPSEVYQEKMANPYQGGAPDDYYEGSSDILWVEWKYYQKLPLSVDLLNTKASVKLSKLQHCWLTRAHTNGRNVAVIAGSSQGGVIFRIPDLETPLTREEFLERAMTRQEIAAWIAIQTLGKSK